MLCLLWVPSPTASPPVAVCGAIGTCIGYQEAPFAAEGVYRADDSAPWAPAWGPYWRCFRSGRQPRPRRNALSACPPDVSLRVLRKKLRHVSRSDDDAMATPQGRGGRLSAPGCNRPGPAAIICSDRASDETRNYAVMKPATAGPARDAARNPAPNPCERLHFGRTSLRDGERE